MRRVVFQSRFACRVAVAMAIWLCVSGFLTQSAFAEFPTEFPEERLDFSIEESSDGRLHFHIRTTIPTPFEAVVEIALAGQEPRDIYIGHAERVFIDRPESEIVLDLSRTRMQLPAGTYQARVAFYNAWGWRNGNPRAADAPDTIIRKSVLLRAAGLSPADTRSRAEKQRWVFLNVKPQTRWVPQFFTRNIGDFEVLETGDIQILYFPKAQVTFLVSTEGGQIVGWQFGRAETDKKS